MFFDDDFVDHYTLLVTGNGFDIALNLPTRYEDFFNVLKKAKASSTFEVFYQTIQDSLINEKDCLSFYSAFKACEKTNYFVRYFISYNKIFDKWCDVEQEIKDVVLSFDTFLFNISKSNSTYSKFYTAGLEGVKTLNIFHPEFVKQWNEFGFRTDDDYVTGTLIDTDYVGPLTTYALKNRFQEIQKTIIETLYSDLQNFKLVFSLYIKCFANCNHLAIPKNLSADYVITYNYTKASELCINPTDKTFYIHGKDENIVLGIGSDEKFHDHRFNRFTKLNQRTGISNMDINDYLGEGSLIGYIGFSFNINDKETIIEYFKQKDTTHIIYFLDETARNDLVDNLINIITFEKYNELFNSDKIQFQPSSSLFD